MILNLTFILFFALLFLGMPVAMVLGISSMFYFLISGQIELLYVVPHRMFSGLNSFVLMAIPWFMFAGEIMNQGKVSSKLVEFADILVGRIRGGLAHTNVLASMFFGGISGSALSDVAALGSMLIPAMEEAGYDRKFSAAVTAASAIQGPVIPPSIPAVLISGVTGISVGALFLAGAIPGILIGAICCLIVAIISSKRNYPKRTKKIPFSKAVKSTLSIFPALLAPFIILAGILLGLFTPTEAAIIAGLYTLAITGLVYKTLTFEGVVKAFKNTLFSTAKIFLIIATANVFSWILSLEMLPTKLASALLHAAGGNRNLALLMINIVVLFWGMWLDTAPIIMVLVPLLYPLSQQLGIHPVHFGAVILLNLMLGQLTPPFGMTLFATQSIAKVELTELLKDLWPFLVGALALLLIITYYPSIVLFLPKLFGLA